MVLYGSVVWGHRIPASFKPLVRVQRLGMLPMGHFLKSMPTAGMEVIMGLTPLALLAKEGANITARRIAGIVNPGWDGVGYRHKRGHLCLAGGLRVTPTDRITPRYGQAANYNVNGGSFKKGDAPAAIAGIHAYTDGSKLRDGRAGYGYVVAEGDTLISAGEGYLGSYASVFQAELLPTCWMMAWLVRLTSFLTPGQPLVHWGQDWSSPD